MIERILVGLVVILFFGWYEVSSIKICEKNREEVVRDMIIFFLIFLAIYIFLGEFYFNFFNFLKVKEKIKKFPFYFSLVIGFLATGTFRSATGLIRITKKDEEKEDRGLQVVKIRSEMLMIFLGTLISISLILVILGIKWWKYELIVYSVLAGVLVWIVVWANLPGTYSSLIFKVLAILFVVIHLSLGVFCARVFDRGWNPIKESYFEFKERIKKEKSLAFKRERVLKLKKKKRRILPSRRKKVLILREVLIPRMIYFDQKKVIKVKPKEKVRLIFHPNYSWIWEEVLGYEIFIDKVHYEVSREELKKGIVVWEFKNSEVPKKIIVKPLKKVIFE